MFRTLLENKHTSIAAGLYLTANLVAKLGAVWFPSHKEQFDATTSIIESFAVTYGLVMAGDAKKTPPPTNL